MTATVAAWLGQALHETTLEPPSPATGQSGTTLRAAFEAAGMHVTPLTLPRLGPPPGSFAPAAGEGAHLRLRLAGVSRPDAQPAVAPAGIAADLYLSAWKVVPVQGSAMLLVEIRVTDPLGGRPLWSQALLTRLDEFGPLERALQQAISQALARSLERRRELLTV